MPRTFPRRPEPQPGVNGEYETVCDKTGTRRVWLPWPDAQQARSLADASDRMRQERPAYCCRADGEPE